MWSSFKDVSSTYHDWKHWVGTEACEIAGIGCKDGKAHNGTVTETSASDTSTAWMPNSAIPTQTISGNIASESFQTSISSYYETSPDAWTLSYQQSSLTSSPTVATTSLYSASSSIALSSAASATNGTTPSVTPAPNQPGAQVNHNMRQVLTLFGAGLGIGIIFYLLFCVELRFLQFIRNVVKLLFKRNSFENDSEMGLNSESFNTDDNVQRSDTRSGLSRPAKLRVLWYMFVYGETFDEARLRYVQYKFASNGISADGSPLDPKFIRYD